MPFDLWMSFFIAAAILVVVPGPDNIFVTLQSAIYGPRAGIFVTLGLCVGVCFHTCLVSLGIATIVAASPILLFIIQCIGASYLLYLAWGGLGTLQSIRERSRESPPNNYPLFNIGAVVFL